MALTKCRECRKEISSDARTCPHCGCPSDKEKRVAEIKEQDKKGCAWIFAIIFIILAIISFIRFASSL